MVTPLVVGDARVVAQKNADTADRSRAARAARLIAEKSSSTRFTQTQSLAARSTSRQKLSRDGVGSLVASAPLFSRTLARAPRQRISQQNTQQGTGGVAQNIFGAIRTFRLITPLLPFIIPTTTFALVLGVLGAALLIVSGLIDWATIGYIEGHGIGFLVLGLAFVILLLEVFVIFVWISFAKRVSVLRKK